jgi:hypothetical protein
VRESSRPRSPISELEGVGARLSDLQEIINMQDQRCDGPKRAYGYFLALLGPASTPQMGAKCRLREPGSPREL